MKNLWKKIQDAFVTFKCLDGKSKALIICIPLMLIIIILSISELVRDTKRDREALLPKEERVFLQIPESEDMDSAIHEERRNQLNDLDEYWDSIKSQHTSVEPLHNCKEEPLYEYWYGDDRGDIECKVMTRQEFMQEDRNQKAELMNMLLSTDKGKTFLHYSVILAGMVLLFLAYIFFLITWRATKRMMRPKIVKETIKQVCEIPDDVLRKNEVFPWFNNDYLASLKDKYQYYGDENSKEFVEWAYRKITRSDDFKLEDREHFINQLRWGYILDLRDYDWMVRICKRRDFTIDEQAAIVDELESWDNHNNKVHERPLIAKSEFENEEWPIENNEPSNIKRETSVDDDLYQGIGDPDTDSFESPQCKEPFEDYSEGFGEDEMQKAFVEDDKTLGEEKVRK